MNISKDLILDGEQLLNRTEQAFLHNEHVILSGGMFIFIFSDHNIWYIIIVLRGYCVYFIDSWGKSLCGKSSRFLHLYKKSV